MCRLLPNNGDAMTITALYAGLLVPIFLLLTMRVIQARRSGRVAVGDGGDMTLLRRIRVQANFAESVPLALLLLALAESVGAPGWMLHALGMALLLGRAVHAYGMSQPKEQLVLRVVGTSTTLGVLGLAALACVVYGGARAFWLDRIALL